MGCLFDVVGKYLLRECVRNPQLFYAWGHSLTGNLKKLLPLAVFLVFAFYIDQKGSLFPVYAGVSWILMLIFAL